ncbi:restriction endonuclease [Lacticaseibacillus salsurivasis]|uniref:restriction endonuclease n=1 Tax=Lacticaseibacillus salsurivasis TaxID=3081441 RepID=UPI0030C6A5EA
MQGFMRRLYWWLTVLFGLALVYAFFGRGYLHTWQQQLDLVAFAAIVAWAAINAALIYRRHFHFRDLQLENVDAMEGEEFEQFCVYLLKRNGFKHLQTTKASGDQGIDIIGVKKKKQVGFQCKRYTGQVGNKAVQEAWSGQAFYKLDEAMVLTNSEFTDAAKELAEQLGVTLIDRPRLKRLMRRLPS